MFYHTIIGVKKTRSPLFETIIINKYIDKQNYNLSNSSNLFFSFYQIILFKKFTTRIDSYSLGN